MGPKAEARQTGLCVECGWPTATVWRKTNTAPSGHVRGCYESLPYCTTHTPN